MNQNSRHCRGNVYESLTITASLGIGRRGVTGTEDVTGRGRVAERLDGKAGDPSGGAVIGIMRPPGQTGTTKNTEGRLLTPKSEVATITSH